MADNKKVDEVANQNDSASNRIRTVKKKALEMSVDGVKPTTTKSTKATKKRKVKEESVGSSFDPGINSHQDIQQKPTQLSTTNIPTEPVIRKIQNSRKKGAQTSLFENIDANTIQKGTETTNTKIPLQNVEKIKKVNNYFVSGEELKKFASSVAAIMDGALIAAIEYIDTTPQEYVRLAAKNKYNRKEVEEIINIKKEIHKVAFEKLSHENIKAIIKNIVLETPRKEDSQNIELIRDDLPSNQTVELSLYAQILKKSLMSCCVIILKTLERKDTNFESELSAKQKLYSEFIEELLKNIDDNSFTMTSISNMVETECLSFVAGLIGFSNDIISISTKMQFRFNELNSIEYTISKFTIGGKSDWSSQLKNIILYDNNMNIGDRKIDQINAEIHVEQTNEPTDQNIPDIPSSANEQDKGHQINSINPSLNAGNESLTSTVNVNPAFPDDLDRIDKHGDEVNHLQSDYEPNIHEIQNRCNVKRNIIFILILLIGLSASALYYYRDRLVVFNSENTAQVTIKDKSSKYLNQSDVERYLYARPEIGKLLILYKNYLPLDYSKLMKNLLSRNILEGGQSAERDVTSQIIQDIDNNLISHSSRISLGDMDEIIYYENILVNKLADSSQEVCNSLLPHRNSAILNTGYINIYLGDIAAVLIAELEAIQNSNNSPEIAKDMTSADWKDLEEIYKMHQIKGINAETLILALSHQNPPSRALSCKEVSSILHFISGIQDDLRFKLSRQVFFK